MTELPNSESDFDSAAPPVLACRQCAHGPGEDKSRP